MNPKLQASTTRLAEARQRGNADEIAEALAVHANDLLQNARTAEARAELDEAAAIHHSCGRIYDQARCTQFAATLCRFEGRLAEAKQRSNQALNLCQSKGPIAVSAFAELGEIATAEGNAGQAAATFGAALGAGDSSGLIDSARAALLRKRASALSTAGKFQEAIQDLQSAHGLLVRAGDSASALRTQVEEATAHQHAGQFGEAARIARHALPAADSAGDAAAQADLHLLLVTDAIDRHDLDNAMVSAQKARQYALSANAPTSYTGAAQSIAKIADAKGDRLAAYEALAAGWATLADLLGKDLARLTFEPSLKELRERWGAPAFFEIKTAYEVRRRSKFPKK